MTPIQLIGPASLVGNSRETFHKSGTDGSNPESVANSILGEGGFADEIAAAPPWVSRRWALVDEE